VNKMTLYHLDEMSFILHLMITSIDQNVWTINIIVNSGNGS